MMRAETDGLLRLVPAVPGFPGFLPDPHQPTSPKLISSSAAPPPLPATISSPLVECDTTLLLFSISTAYDLVVCAPRPSRHHLLIIDDLLSLAESPPTSFLTLNLAGSRLRSNHH
jgi:hypothetical protein